MSDKSRNGKKEPMLFKLPADVARWIRKSASAKHQKLNAFLEEQCREKMLFK